jgi:hypothetical protein
VSKQDAKRDPMTTQEDEVLQAADQRASALASGDAGELRELLHSDFVWISHKGEVFDRDQYVLSNTGSGLRWSRQQFVDPIVRIVGATGVLTAIVVDEVEVEGIAQTFKLLATLVWVREADKWLCLGGHAGPRIS